MSEFINNSFRRKESLKEILRRLHGGVALEVLTSELEGLLTELPYGEVVEAEQELIEEGLPVEELVKMCDLHSRLLNDQITTQGMKLILPGHPVHTFQKENEEILKIAEASLDKIKSVLNNLDSVDFEKEILHFRSNFNLLGDIEKHYSCMENLVFPFLEKAGITGPPKVMWGKHDEIREILKATIESLANIKANEIDDFKTAAEFLLKPTLNLIIDMVGKEEKILFPMTLDKLTDTDWYQIYQQVPEIGYCLYDPQVEWKPAGLNLPELEQKNDEIHLSTGSFTKEELEAILSAVPVDLTFVDKNDKVKFFSQKDDRVFTRTRAILKRDVRMCHPPSSMHIVDKIINDFKTGKANRAPFWINFQGKFILIEYYAIRDKNGEYLGTLESTQDLTEARNLQGEQRILSYEDRR
ncbi:MAG: hemerythrin [Ignavibacteria bacterium GWF2_33_9]|nr:MAG: hemerythrin [Ignavibacteria bacterium GWF2_33_9]